MPYMLMASMRHITSLTLVMSSVYDDGMEEPNSERVITPMPKSLVASVDDYRFANRMPSRAEAIRRLIEMGLRAAGLGESLSPKKRGPKTR